jgi:hypothetical protein
MNLPTKTPAVGSPSTPTNTDVELVSVPKMNRLLAQAAQLAAGAGLPPEAFANIAWQAYLKAFPEIAERMAEAEFVSALEQLRVNGRLAKA